jgi:hypothetical protein
MWSSTSQESNHDQPSIRTDVIQGLGATEPCTTSPARMLADVRVVPSLLLDRLRTGIKAECSETPPDQPLCDGRDCCRPSESCRKVEACRVATPRPSVDISSPKHSTCLSRLSRRLRQRLAKAQSAAKSQMVRILSRRRRRRRVCVGRAGNAARKVNMARASGLYAPDRLVTLARPPQSDRWYWHEA